MNVLLSLLIDSISTNDTHNLQIWLAFNNKISKRVSDQAADDGDFDHAVGTLHYQIRRFYPITL
jgi:hypothetical protein